MLLSGQHGDGAEECDGCTVRSSDALLYASCLPSVVKRVLGGRGARGARGVGCAAVSPEHATTIDFAKFML